MHYVAEVMRRFYADRNAYLGDPDFVKNPIAAAARQALHRDAARVDRSDEGHAQRHARCRAGHRPESAETTHYNVVDAEGNAVAVTYTLNGGFGNGITVPGLGFLLNNEMDDFTSKPGAANLFGLVQGEANTIAPGKRPLSSMAPTIVLKDGQLYMLLGGPGGSRIPTAVLQVFLNVVDFGMNPQEAVDAPRFHHQWLPDQISVERGFSPDALALLRSRGHEVRQEAGPVCAVVEADRQGRRLAAGRRRRPPLGSRERLLRRRGPLFLSRKRPHVGRVAARYCYGDVSHQTGRRRPDPCRVGTRGGAGLAAVARAARDGLVRAFREPATWPTTLTKRWNVEVGTGYATPLVVGEPALRLHAPGRERGDDGARRRSAKVLWRTSYPAPFKMNPATAPHGRDRSPRRPSPPTGCSRSASAASSRRSTRDRQTDLAEASPTRSSRCTTRRCRRSSSATR